jgi:hypothetical protein
MKAFAARRCGDWIILPGLPLNVLPKAVNECCGSAFTRRCNRCREQRVFRTEANYRGAFREEMRKAVRALDPFLALWRAIRFLTNSSHFCLNFY